MLPLPQIKQWHHRRLLVLARVPADHLLDELFVDGIELEGDARVVVFGVAVLYALSIASLTEGRENLRH